MKAYNNFMSGVDRHDRMVGQQPIQLTSKRGYKKLFFHVLDTATVNAWILYKTARQARHQWNKAARAKDTLAWFKEKVILSLCGNFTTRRRTAQVYAHTEVEEHPEEDTFQNVLRHQIRPVSDIPQLQWTTAKRCLICRDRKRTACVSCKQPYCFKCGIKHQTQILQSSIGNIEASRVEQTSQTYTSTQTATSLSQHTLQESDRDSDSEGESFQAE